MTDISEADEREAREWLLNLVNNWPRLSDRHARTILALLDRPRLPKPHEVPDDLLTQMTSEFCAKVVEYAPRYAMRAAYRTLYDHYTAPPAPKKVEAWGVRDKTGLVGTAERQDDAKAWAKQSAGRWVVRLVEADSHE